MSTKGRSRGRKAVAAEVTQENIVDSTSTDKSELKAQDAAPEISEKDKKGSKRKQAATENGTTESNVVVPVKRGRGRPKEKESTPVEEEKPAPVEKETKSKRGGKKATQASDTAVEKSEDTTTVESKPSVPAKKGRGKKVAVEPEPEPEPEAEPETQPEPDTKEETESKKSAKGKRGAKKEKVEEAVEDAVASNGNDVNIEKESAEAAEDEGKDDSAQPAKRGRGRKAAPQKEEKQPVKTAAAKKMVVGERSRKRGADSKEDEEKEEPAENGDEEVAAAAAAAAVATGKKGGRGRKRGAEPAKKPASENGAQDEEDGEVITGK